MIASNIQTIKAKIPENVTLVAVSKLQSLSAILEAYRTGQRHFGENRPQEFAVKYDQLPQDIVWHLIGHLQTNKVKMVVGKAAFIHSIDSDRLLWAVEKEALKQEIVQKCLLEFHIAIEESKSGFSYDEVLTLITSPELHNLKAVKICGIMGMASYVADEQQIRAEFRTLKHYYDQIKQSFFPHDPEFCHLSMGMSGDWPIAVTEGSTMIRVGSQIFGSRNR